MGKFTAIQTYDRFTKLRNANKIDERSLNFILDTGQLYTHGIFLNNVAWGTETTGAVELTIAGVKKALSLSNHTHSNYLEKNKNIDLGTNKIVSGNVDLLYYSLGNTYLGNTSSPLILQGSSGSIKKGDTIYTILDTLNFTILATSSAGHALQNAAKITYGSSTFLIDYVKRLNTTLAFNDLIAYTNAGVTLTGSKYYAFLTLRNDGSDTANWAQLRFDIASKSLQYRTSADNTTWYSVVTSIPVNALNVAGIVTAPTSNDGNKFWGTDSNGNPGWKTITNSLYYLTLNGTVYGNANTTNLGTFYAIPTSDASAANQVWMRNADNNGYTWRTLGNRAFDSTDYLPLSGGTLTNNSSTEILTLSNTQRMNKLVFNSTYDSTTYKTWVGLEQNWYGTGYGAWLAFERTVDSSMKVYALIVRNNGLTYLNLDLSTDGRHEVLTSYNSSVSKSGETLSVKINGTTLSLTNTWRGILNNLTSDSTTDSLSAAQGKALNTRLSSVEGNYVNLTGNQTITGQKVFLLTISTDSTIYYNLCLSLNTYSDTGKRVAAIGFGNLVGTKAAIGYERTGSYDKGRIVFAFSDRNDLSVANYDDIKIAFYNNGAINAASFVKTGGTGSQFLKADGSVDSNAYLPLSGGTLTGDVGWSSDGHKLYFYNNAAIGKVQGWGLALYGERNSTSVFISDGTNYYPIIHTGNYTTYCAPASHTHDYLPLSGGTMTGALSINTSTAYESPALKINYYSGYSVNENSIAQVKFGPTTMDCYLGVAPSSYTIFGKNAYFFHVGDNYEFDWMSSGWSKLMALEASTGNLWIKGTLNGGTPITSSNVGSQSVNYASSAGNATYATNATRLYASDSPYCYGDSAPYYAYFTYNDYSDNRWYMRVSPATPAAIRVDYATDADTLDGYHYNNLPYHPINGSWKPSSLSSYTRHWGWAYSSAEAGLASNGSEMQIYTDGMFWQREGAYYCLDNGNTYVASDGTNRGIINGTEVASARHLLINGVTWNSDWNWSGQSGQPTWLWGSNDGVNMYIWNPSNFSVNYANYAGYLNYSETCISSSAAGWYKLASINTTDARGSIRLALITTGGNWVPYYAELMVKEGWNVIEFNQYGRFDYISSYRYTRDDSKCYIEAYFTGALTLYVRKFVNLGYINDYTVDWTLYSGTAIAGSGTVISEANANTDASLYTSGNIYACGLINTNSSFRVNGYSGAYHSSNNISGLAGEIWFGGNFHIDSQNGQNLYLNYYSQYNTYINARGGNVGIGTDSPGYKLDLNGSMKLQGGVMHIWPGGNNYYDEGIRIHPASNGWITIALCGTDNTGDTGVTGNSWNIHKNPLNNFFINRGSSDSHTGYELCNVGGNWGINTVSPTNKITVEDVCNDSVPTILTKSTRDGSWVYGASFLAPNLTNGHNIYIGLGQSHGTRNYFGLTHYHYGDGSTSNYGAVEIYGLGNIQRWYYGDMRTWFAGRVDASGFYHNSYGSSAYALTSDGGVALISLMSVNYANSAGSVAWDNITSKPDTATRWPSWSEVTGKPSTFTPSEHAHNYLPVSGGTMTGTPYINMPASAASLSNSQPFGITYGRIQGYGNINIAGDTDGSTNEYVIITAGYGISDSTIANGLAIGYNSLTWKGNTIIHSGNISSYVSGSSNVNLQEISFRKEGTTDPIKWIAGCGSGAEANDYFVILNYSNWKAALTINNSTNNVYIGPTDQSSAPSYKLHVNGTAGIEGNLTMNGNIYMGSKTIVFNYGSNSGANLYCDSSNFNIQTSSLYISTAGGTTIGGSLGVTGSARINGNLDINNGSDSSIIVHHHSGYDATYIIEGSQRKVGFQLGYSNFKAGIWDYTNDTWSIYFDMDNNAFIAGSCNAHGFNNISDIRIKNIIEQVSPLNIYDIANAPLFKFTWKDESRYSGLHIGSSAQYWHTILPELTAITNDSDQILSMQYDVIALVSAITVAKKVISHEERINILENENRMLKEKIIALEQTYKEIEQLD